MAAACKRFARNLHVNTPFRVVETNKKGAAHLHNSLIYNVGTTRFELATTRPPDVYSTGLSYVPLVTPTFGLAISPAPTLRLALLSDQRDSNL